jgi:hypothetical protein
MQDERSFITYPTWEKYMILSCFIETLRVKEKRQLFHTMRRYGQELDHNCFFPQYGITAGEFAVWQVLSESRKGRSKKEDKE